MFKYVINELLLDELQELELLLDDDDDDDDAIDVENVDLIIQSSLIVNISSNKQLKLLFVSIDSIDAELS